MQTLLHNSQIVIYVQKKTDPPTFQIVKVELEVIGLVKYIILLGYSDANIKIHKVEIPQNCTYVNVPSYFSPVGKYI